MPTKLGQNFLKNRNVLEKIIQSADLKPDNFLIEIGPGEGVLTEELIKNTKKVLAIEIDKNLADKLQEKYKNKENIKIINHDILKINLPELIEENKFQNYKVIANIPYYITSPIIQLFLETKYPPSEMILMVQKEVAERICASPSGITTKNEKAKNNSKKNNLTTNKIKQSIPRGKPGQMSILSVSVQYYAKPELLFYVDKKSFWPIPEVDSAVIKISRIRRGSSTSTMEVELPKTPEVKKFFRIVRAGFSAKRKTLLNNLSSSLHLEKKQAEEKLKKAGIIPTQRAQELSIEDWKKLSVLFE